MNKKLILASISAIIIVAAIALFATSQFNKIIVPTTTSTTTTTAATIATTGPSTDNQIYSSLDQELGATVSGISDLDVQNALSS